MIKSKLLTKLSFNLVCTLLFGVAIFTIDRLSKALAVKELTSYGEVIFNDYLAFDLTYNRGVTWGIGDSWGGVSIIILHALTCLIIALLLNYTVYRYKKGLSIYPEILILAGALSNLLDRFVYGAVVDFISLSYGSYSWPIFNIADIAIVMGVFLIFCRIFIDGQSKS